MIAPMSVVITTQLPRLRGNAIPLGSKEKSAITTLTTVSTGDRVCGKRGKRGNGRKTARKAHGFKETHYHGGRGNAVVSVVMSPREPDRLRTHDPP